MQQLSTCNHHQHDVEYDQLLKTLALSDESLFTTDVDLWSVYLTSFTDPAERQYHNCHACRQFIERYGHLVTIDAETGEQKSAIWTSNPVPALYVGAVHAMKRAVESAKVTGVFLSSEKVLGTPVTGEFVHYSVHNPRIYQSVVLTAGQAMAEKKEDYRNVSRAIAQFNLTTLEQVVELLTSDSLYRSEKVLGQAQWLYDLKRGLTDTKNQMIKKNKVWKAIADAPAGFCHPRSSMIGTLLEDLDNGYSFNAAAERFKQKMHPLKYQRPTAAPTENSIEVAEKLVKQLGVERSLERQYAMMADMQSIWKPQGDVQSDTGGVFGHLKGGSSQDRGSVDAGKITWEKFQAEVLPKARKIEVHLPNGRSSYVTFVTAAHDDAPCIFQWGNHVSWYHWHGGSVPGQYGLMPGWVEAEAVCLPPYMWGEQNLTHFDRNAFFILKGARETRNEGNALFPETLKSELRGIRKVIEAHSRRSKIIDVPSDHVVGKGINCVVRVHTSVVTQYEIDRLS